MESIRVTVVEFGDRKHYQMQYRDPINGRKKTRSTGVARTGRKKQRTEAERVAAKWESELREGRYREASVITWQNFRHRYESEVLTGLAQGTDQKVQGVFNLLERIVNPQRLRELTAERISHFQAKLRDGGRSESTIAGYLAHLKAALRLGCQNGHDPQVRRTSVDQHEQREAVL